MIKRSNKSSESWILVFSAMLLFIMISTNAFAWTNSTGGDHNGATWYPATDNISQSISGYHYNISTFGINASNEVNITPYNASGGGNLTIKATYVIISGKLNGSGRGFSGGNMSGVNGSGPGKGTGIINNGGGGAGYGGAGGIVYGSVNNISIEMGSGGGSGEDNPGGEGGGNVTLSAITSIIITGIVDVNGSQGVDRSGNSGGGGSGGGLLIKTDGFANISGKLYAVGGKGGNGDSSSAGGGGGGGVG